MPEIPIDYSVVLFQFQGVYYYGLRVRRIEGKHVLHDRNIPLHNQGWEVARLYKIRADATG